MIGGIAGDDAGLVAGFQMFDEPCDVGTRGQVGGIWNFEVGIWKFFFGHVVRVRKVFHFTISTLQFTIPQRRGWLDGVHGLFGAGGCYNAFAGFVAGAVGVPGGGAGVADIDGEGAAARGEQQEGQESEVFHGVFGFGLVGRRLNAVHPKGLDIGDASGANALQYLKGMAWLFLGKALGFLQGFLQCFMPFGGWPDGGIENVVVGFHGGSMI